MSQKPIQQNQSSIIETRGIQTQLQQYLICILKNRGYQPSIDCNCHCNVNITIICKTLPILTASIHNWVLNKCHCCSLCQQCSHCHTLWFHLMMLIKSSHNINISLIKPTFQTKLHYQGIKSQVPTIISMYQLRCSLCTLIYN